MTSGRCGLLVLLLACPAWTGQFKPADPQQQPADQRPPPSQPRDEPSFSAQVSLVRVLATVHDTEGRLVTSLDRSDFTLTDGGVRQEIAVFERNTSLPVSVAVLLDTSGSTHKELHFEIDSVVKFLHAFAATSNASDAFAIYSFNWQIRLERDFSLGLGSAERALRNLHGSAGTSLYDAIYLASSSLSPREGRHAAVVVTDGGDTTSYKSFQQALESAQRADVVRYPVVVVPIANEAGRNLGGEHALATLAAQTGGRSFSPYNAPELDAAFREVLPELRTQYLIGYYPRQLTGAGHAYHAIGLETRDRTLRVSARSGYYEP